MAKEFKGNQFGNLSPIERFFKYIKVSDKGCWEFQLKPNKNGYCLISVSSHDILAHRFSYMHFIGTLNSIKVVCHKCDNKICVNPFHLFKGDHKDNYHDSQDKGIRPTAKCPSYQMYARHGCRCQPCVDLMRERGRSTTKKYRENNKEFLAQKRKEEREANPEAYKARNKYYAEMAKVKGNGPYKRKNKK